jgi:glyceraldehyde-3-phosphate dehydrogenase (NADP+)
MTYERVRTGEVRSATGSGADSEFGAFGVLINGQRINTDDAIEVRSPYDDALVAVAHNAGPDLVEKAIQTAHDAFQTTRKLPAWQRTEVLEKISEGIKANHERFSRAIALEAGKPIRTARAEVDRAVFTFKIAAEEARRIYGEIVPLDWLPGNEGRVAHIRRVPRGPIVGISPFNFPLNLVAHKVAPAIAAGNPIIIRPASQTPVSALMLGDLVLEAGWPEGGIAVVPTRVANAKPFVEDDRIKLLTFTGSPAVGWMLKTQAGMKPVTLELGGNAGTIVNDDADIAFAAGRVAWGGFSYAGQSCISVQRVYVHQARYEEFLDGMIPKVKALKVGNPLEDATDVGPVIDTGAADRIGAWLEEAVNGGAKVLTGGSREGNVWQPAVLTDIEEDMNVSCQEVFGPIVVVYPFDDPMAAIHAVDSSSFGLQAGLFTNSMALVNRAFEELEVGGIMVNDVSTYRIDHMPYGGVKRSGFGREGLRYAIEEMTEMKLLTFNNRAD